jgi:hypothetical protein
MMRILERERASTHITDAATVESTLSMWYKTMSRTESQVIRGSEHPKRAIPKKNIPPWPQVTPRKRATNQYAATTGHLIPEDDHGG